MKKLVLDLDTLQVDSFATATPETARGTVNAHIYTPDFLKDALSAFICGAAR